MAFSAQNKAKLCKNLIITVVFEKNANVFTEHCQKLQKIVIITSTPSPLVEAKTHFLLKTFEIKMKS
jgi:predicted dinucleotide-binding enzyme